jgi:hypothetical protein
MRMLRRLPLLKEAILPRGMSHSICAFDSRLFSSRYLKYMPSHELRGSSVLEIEVYRHHTIGSDDYIGGAKESIEFLVAEGATGGRFLSLGD